MNNQPATTAAEPDEDRWFALAGAHIRINRHRYPYARMTPEGLIAEQHHLALKFEIQAHNAAVDARKVAKRGHRG